MAKISFFILMIVFTGLSARAESYELDGVNITPVVKYYRAQVKTLNTSITVFHWSSSQNDSQWTPTLTDKDSLEILRLSSRTFWNNFGQNLLGNMFGTGLYLAEDPVSSKSYGGRSDSWLLLQLKLPIGFKMLDFGGDNKTKLDPTSSLEILSKFECQIKTTADLFRHGGAYLSSKCRQLVQKIFDDILQIDAFAYGWSNFHFEGCVKGRPLESHRAFVLLRPESLTPGSARYFTVNSNDHLEDRILIQTLSLLVTDGNLRCPEGQKCQPPALITSREAKQLQSYLIWKDLDGVPKTPDALSWIKKNKFACDGKLPYVEDEILGKN